MFKTTLYNVKKYIDDHGINITIHEDYSGRCMFGKTCLGFSGDRFNVRDVAEYVRRHTKKTYSEDQLGLDIIVYFPTINPQ